MHPPNRNEGEQPQMATGISANVGSAVRTFFTFISGFFRSATADPTYANPARASKGRTSSRSIKSGPPRAMRGHRHITRWDRMLTAPNQHYPGEAYLFACQKVSGKTRRLKKSHSPQRHSPQSQAKICRFRREYPSTAV